jgi:hypothetical protein
MTDVTNGTASRLQPNKKSLTTGEIHFLGVQAYQKAMLKQFRAIIIVNKRHASMLLGNERPLTKSNTSTLLLNKQSLTKQLLTSNATNVLKEKWLLKISMLHCFNGKKTSVNKWQCFKVSAE